MYGRDLARDERKRLTNGASPKSKPASVESRHQDFFTCTSTCNKDIICKSVVVVVVVVTLIRSLLCATTMPLNIMDVKERQKRGFVCCKFIW